MAYVSDNASRGAKRSKQSEMVKTVRDAIQDSWEHDRDNRREAASDLAFLAGDQWPDVVRQQREAEGRPMLTMNRMPQFVRQITNDIRQADLAIKVAPVDDDNDPQLAKIYNGILRQIHYRSSAHHVYASCAEHQTACGIGWWRVVTDYAAPDSFDQEVLVKRIPSPLSVYCDPAAVEPDRSDANWIAVTEMVPRSEFKRRYPEAAEVEIETPGDQNDSAFFWATDDSIRIAEYWCKKPIKREIGLTADNEVVPLDGIQKEMWSLMGVVQTRTVDDHKIESYLVTGAEVLEGPFEWPGRYIPIVPVIGGEFPLENRTYRFGAIRFAKDAQQLYNFEMTAGAESVALAPKAPWLVTPDMIAGTKRMWDSANRHNRPYLVYTPDPKAPGAAPKREHGPEVPVAVLQMAQHAAEDMKATTGIYDAALGARSNETSGKAILARQQEGDVANFHFVDNLKRSLEYTGRIIIDLIPRIYDNERVVRLMGDDGSETPVRVNQVQYERNGVPVMLNDLSAARFDVRVTIGPAYTTKRMEAAESILQFMQAYPSAGPLAGDIFAKMMDFPESEVLAKRLKAALPPEIAAADQSEDGTPPPPQPDPMQQQMMMMQLEKLTAEIDKLRSETEKNRASGLKSLQEAETEDLRQQVIGSPMGGDMMDPHGSPLA